MIHVVFDEHGEPKRCGAVVDGRRYPVYLDTDMLQELAKGDGERRKRFVGAMRERGTLLFSEASLVEVGRLDGRSANLVADLLTSLGHYWAPLRMSIFSVLESPDDPANPGPVSAWFLGLYWGRRTQELSDAGTILDKSSPQAFAAQFCDLGKVVAWGRDAADTYRAHLNEVYVAVRDSLAPFRADYEKDPGSLDVRLPVMPFAREDRLMYVARQLMRILVMEYKSRRLTRNDGIDFCHATMAATYACIVSLDKAWKRRVEALAIPAGLLRLFYRPEADQLVSLLETLPWPITPPL
jgi:hypothetical protein